MARKPRISDALDAITEVASFNLTKAGPPDMRMRGILRFEPTNWAAAGPEIANHLRQGRAVSVDFKGLESEDAVRLIDYCSGATEAVGGWIFRVADQVIVISPGDLK